MGQALCLFDSGRRSTESTMSDGMSTTMPCLVPSEALNTDCNNRVLVLREDAVIGGEGEEVQSKVGGIKCGLSARYDKKTWM